MTDPRDKARDSPRQAVPPGDAPRVRLSWRFHVRRPVVRGALLLALLMCGSAAIRRATGRDRPGDMHTYHDRTFPVVRILDGDTFDVAAPDGEHAETRVRLWGVDTPEVEGSRDGAMFFGAEASAFAKEWLVDRGIRLVLDPRRTRDLYGRLLAYAYLDDDPVSFNERLIEGGFAYADLRFEHAYQARFEALEAFARRQGTGLWKNVRPADMPAWRRRMEAARN